MAFNTASNNLVNDFQQEYLGKILNTALLSHLSSEAAQAGVPLAEIESLMKTPAYQTLSHAVLELSRRENISEKAAADQIISVIQRLQGAWSQVLIQEGLSSLQSGSSV